MNRLIKVWRLTLSFLAASLNSFSIFWFRSTPTFPRGGIILPVFVKYDETSLPLSASRAIDSADVGRLVLEAFFIEHLFFAGSFPQGHQVKVFSSFVFPNFKNHRVKTTAGPANGAVLLRPILSLILIIGMTEYLLRFFKTDPALRIPSESGALLLVKLEAHKGTL